MKETADRGHLKGGVSKRPFGGVRDRGWREIRHSLCLFTGDVSERPLRGMGERSCMENKKETTSGCIREAAQRGSGGEAGGKSDDRGHLLAGDVTERQLRGMGERGCMGNKEEATYSQGMYQRGRSEGRGTQAGGKSDIAHACSQGMYQRGRSKKWGTEAGGK